MSNDDNKIKAERPDNVNKFQWQKILLIKTILNTIKNNPGITSDLLLAKLTVEPPYFNEAKAFNYIKNLAKVGRIYIDNEDVVTVVSSTKG